MRAGVGFHHRRLAGEEIRSERRARRELAVDENRRRRFVPEKKAQRLAARGGADELRRLLRGREVGLKPRAGDEEVRGVAERRARRDHVHSASAQDAAGRLEALQAPAAVERTRRTRPRHLPAVFRYAPFLRVFRRRVPPAEPHDEREPRALPPPFARGRHVAAHQTHETHADHEPEPGASLPTRARLVHLLERREQRRAVARREARARVRHLKEQTHVRVVVFLLRRASVRVRAMRRVRSSAFERDVGGAFLAFLGVSARAERSPRFRRAPILLRRRLSVVARRPLHRASAPFPRVAPSRRRRGVQHVSRVFVLFQRAHAEHDAPALGRELHGVADEVGHHLPQPRLVADQPPRDRVVDGVVEHELFGVRLDALHLEAQVHAVLQHERPVLQRELIRLDLGEVQDVVHDGQQRLARARHHVDELHLVAAQALRDLAQKLAPGDDGVERRANLVTGVGEEAGLGLHGGVRPRLRVHEHAPRFVLLGHVAHVHERRGASQRVHGHVRERELDAAAAVDEVGVDLDRRHRSRRRALPKSFRSRS